MKLTIKYNITVRDKERSNKRKETPIRNELRERNNAT
jgi:hypothetical protein